ncbi:MAG TPA: hypothetical protein VML75_06420 [Kofleriaceae bacterium]|nr:hypothetical protein [Kofleriaceae bacterium]
MRTRPLEHRTAARRSWILVVPRIAPTTTGYRHAALPAVADLTASLESAGYRLEVSQVDDLGATLGPMDPRTPLPGAMFLLADRRLGRKTGVIVRISSSADDAASTLGFVEVSGKPRPATEELAMFAISRLGQLLPGLGYKSGDSSLEPDDVALLSATLPDRPRAL